MIIYELSAVYVFQTYRPTPLTINFLHVPHDVSFLAILANTRVTGALTSSIGCSLLMKLLFPTQPAQPASHLPPHKLQLIPHLIPPRSYLIFAPNHYPSPTPRLPLPLHHPPHVPLHTHQPYFSDSDRASLANHPIPPHPCAPPTRCRPPRLVHQHSLSRPHAPSWKLHPKTHIGCAPEPKHVISCLNNTLTYLSPPIFALFPRRTVH
jgi:hypothetical protein